MLSSRSKMRTATSCHCCSKISWNFVLCAHSGLVTQLFTSVWQIYNKISDLKIVFRQSHPVINVGHVFKSQIKFPTSKQSFKISLLLRFWYLLH